jgi:hypothetical protein
MQRTLLVLVAVAGVALLPSLAAAHVTESFPNNVVVKVGWDVEPSESMNYNHVTMQLWDNATGAAITGVTTDNVTLTVTHAGQSKTLDFEESDDDPGNYSAPIEPTQPGIYVVHVKGTINGAKVDADFNVEDVQDIADAQFPARTDPTAQMQQDIATLKSEVAALQAKLNTQSTTTTTLVTQSPVSSTPSSTTRAAASLGASAVVGALAGAAVVLAMRRRSER